MKILHINTLFTPRRFGGAEVFLERLSSDLVTRGHQNLVACLSPTPSRHGNETLQVHEFGLRNIYWPFDGTRHKPWLKAVWHLRNAFGRGSASDIDSLLASEKPDLVHTHNLSGITSAVWQTIGARGIPLIHDSRLCAIVPVRDHVSPQCQLRDPMLGLPISVLVQPRTFAIRGCSCRSQ
jgi:glycosyltransferase involved in cell wall biosynthesis